MPSTSQPYDFTIAVAYDGNAYAIDAPEDFTEWAQYQGCGPLCEFGGMPTEPGVYRIVAVYWFEHGRDNEGRSDPAESDDGWDVIQYEECRIAGSGCFENVPREEQADA